VWFEFGNEEDESNESDESKGEVEQPNSIVRRSEQLRKLFKMYIPPDYHSKFLLTSTDNDPKSIGEAVDSIEGKLMKDAMVEEMESLRNNETWDLVKLPSGINPISREWVFNKKKNTIGQVEKFKA
jgi:hypothetical protein